MFHYLCRDTRDGALLMLRCDFARRKACAARPSSATAFSTAMAAMVSSSLDWGSEKTVYNWLLKAENFIGAGGGKPVVFIPRDGQCKDATAIFTYHFNIEVCLEYFLRPSGGVQDDQRCIPDDLRLLRFWLQVGPRLRAMSITHMRYRRKSGSNSGPEFAPKSWINHSHSFWPLRSQPLILSQ